MIVIRQLQQHLKAKRKQLLPSGLLSILQILKAQEESGSICLTQKGLILQLSAGLCLQQFELLKKLISQFGVRVQSGNFELEKTKTKPRNRHEGGNSTTVKRKKHVAPEAARNAMNLDEMLERQLNTPINTQPRSQNEATLLEGEHHTGSAIAKIEVSPLIYSSIVTPLKKLADESDAKLEEYRMLIDQPSKHKNTTKNKDTIRTRKKASQTQNLTEQINADISLNVVSQVSVKKQLQNILESTKKKKANQKQNLFHHQLFDLLSPAFHYDKKSNLKQFFHQNQAKFSQRKLFLDTPKSSFHAEYDDFPQGSQEMLFVPQQDKEIIAKLDSQIKENNECFFNYFSQATRLSKGKKSIFFYDLLCSQKYTLSQDNVRSFGDIKITLEMNSF